MRSVEDILLQLILQGDSFTYHNSASCPFATPDHVAPSCCIMLHHATHISCIIVLPIMLLPIIVLPIMLLPIIVLPIMLLPMLHVSLRCPSTISHTSCCCPRLRYIYVSRSHNVLISMPQKFIYLGNITL